MIHNIEAQKKQEGKRNNEVDTRLIVRFTKTLLLLPKLFSCVLSRTFIYFSLLTTKTHSFSLTHGKGKVVKDTVCKVSEKMSLNKETLGWEMMTGFTFFG